MKAESGHMANRMSRRDFTRQIAAAGAVAIAGSATGQTAKPKKKPSEEELLAENDLRSLEAKLENPLPERLRNLAKTALTNSRKASKDRLKFALPEGSEPCTTFIPQSARSSDK